MLLFSISGSSQRPVHSEGTEFWMAFMQNTFGSTERNIIISAEEATMGVVEVPLHGWSQSFNVAANSITTVSLPAFVDHNGSEVISDKGIHITAQDTINIVAESLQGLSLGSTSLLPIASLGTDYIISASASLNPSGNVFKSEFVIVAIENNTEIEIIPATTTASGRPAGVPFTVNLKVGESYQVQSLRDDTDLTGSVVRGTMANGDCKPFAVFAGSMCGQVPTSCTGCEHLFLQLTPTNKWADRYFTFHPDLLDEYAYTIIARDNNTTVSIDGVPALLLQAGQWHSTYNATGAHCIEGDKPISITEFLISPDCLGNITDPSIVNLNSDDQFIYATQFETLASNSTPHKPIQNRLAVISEVAHSGTISIDGSLIPPASFTPYASCTNYAVAYMDLTAGQHSFNAPHGAIAYAYGIKFQESYLYSLGSAAPPTRPSGDTLFCGSESPVDLIAPQNFIDPYWTLKSTPGSTVATGQVYSFTPTSSNTYTAWGNLHASGCLTSQDYLVEFDAPPALTVSTTDTALCQTGQVQLGVSTTSSPTDVLINWAPTHLLNNDTIANPIATVNETTCSPWNTEQRMAAVDP